MSAMKTVDTRGEKCPKPIIDTRKALKETSAGETFTVLTDSSTSYRNISRFLSDNKISFTVTEEKGVWTFTVVNEKGQETLTAAETYCETDVPLPASGNWAVAVTSEFMGSGDDILGKKLIKSFFVALSCLDVLPSLIVFYNSGVKLVCNDSDTIELIREIEGKGVELILCGTCVDYYMIGNKLGAGTIGDMYQIMGKLSAAAKVIRP
jgi:selenium metabolism protein YedF